MLNAHVPILGLLASCQLAAGFLPALTLRGSACGVSGRERATCGGPPKHRGQRHAALCMQENTQDGFLERVACKFNAIDTDGA